MQASTGLTSASPKPAPAAGVGEAFAALREIHEDGVALEDSDGNLCFVNEALPKLLGLDPSRALPPGTLATVLGALGLRDEDGAPLTSRQLSGLLARRGHPTPPLKFRMHRDPWDERWLCLTSLSLPNALGGTYVLHLLRDLTGSHHAVQALTLLTEANSVLTASLDIAETVPALVRKVVPWLADACAVDLIDEEGVLRLIALEHAFPDQKATAVELRRCYPQETQRYFFEVLHSGQMQHISGIPDELLQQGAVDAAHLGLLRALEMNATLTVPLITRGRTLGALSLVHSRSGRTFDNAALTLASELAGLIARAVDDTRLIEDLKRSEERLHLALREGRMWYVETDARTGREAPPRSQGFLPEGPRAPPQQSDLVRGIHPEDQAQILSTLGRLHAGESEREEFSYRLLGEDGQLHWIDGVSTLIRDSQRRPLRTVGVRQDVSARRKAEQTLRQSEERLRLVLEAGQLGFFDQDLVNPHSVISSNYETLLGMAPGEYDGTFESFVRCIHPEDVEAAVQRMKQRNTNAQGTLVHSFRVGNATSGVRWIESHSKVVRDAHGRPLRALGAVLDITERKVAEAQGQKLAAAQAARAEAESAQQRLAAILDSISEPLITLDATWHLRFLNRSAVELLGAGRQGQSLGDVPFFRDHSLLLTFCQKALDESGPLEQEISLTDGRWYEVHACRYDAGLSVYLRDITARKREQAVATRLAEHDALRADIATVLATEPNSALALKRCTETLMQRLGMSVARIWLLDPQGTSLEFPADSAWPGGPGETYARIPVGRGPIGAIAVERRPYMTNALLEDPRLLHAEPARRAGLVAFSGHPLLFGQELLGVLALFSKTPLHPEFMLELGSIADTIANGLGRRRAEQALSERAVQLARSNAELEQFAYVASHDLQEPLRVISSFTQLLAQRYHGNFDEKADRYTHFVVDAAARMQRLIQDLLAYSRVGTHLKELVPVDGAGVLQRALLNLQAAIEENHAHVTFDALPWVMGDDLQLEQLFQNLIGNALKFHGEQPPRVHVAVTREEAAWRFSVSDNGIGIAPQYNDRIFIIFQRLHGKSRYAGTGIGLAICKKIVERHGGRIWVESTPGQGATFCFTLPAVRETSTPGVT